jgi:hypothetical protein
MNIFIFQQRSWATKVGIPLAKLLKKNIPDAKFATYIYKPNVWRYIEQDDFKYEQKWLGFKDDDAILADDFDEKYGHISMEEIEFELDIDSVWTQLIHVERSLVYTPGKTYRYSMIKQLSDKQMLDVVRYQYSVAKEIFKSFSPDIIITPGYGSLFHNVLYHYAKKRNISMIALIASKISGFYTITDDNMYRFDNIKKRVEQKNYSPESLEFSKYYIQNFRKNYVPPEHFKGRVFEGKQYVPKEVLKEIIKLPRTLYRALRHNADPLHPKAYYTLEYFPIRWQFKNLFSRHYYTYKAQTREYHQPKQGENFFYFPLHVHPEMSTNLWAPFATNQLEVARQCALALPGKYTLYVKEHPVMVGRRSASFYDKIAGLPNVKLLHPYYSSHQLITSDECRGVIVISSTVGLESMLMSKPVILLSQIFYSIIPQCFPLTDFTKLNALIKKIETINFQDQYYEDALTELIASLKEESFEVVYGSIWGLGKGGNKLPIFEAFLSKIKELEVYKNANK